MAARGTEWSDWVARLPMLLDDLTAEWELTQDGPPMHGHCSMVTPVRTDDGTPAMLKLGFPEPETRGEHFALRAWAGQGAVRLLRADPRRGALVVERLGPRDLEGIDDLEACRIVAGLYRRIHLPPLPRLRSLASLVGRWTAELAELPRSAPIPRRLVEQAVAFGTDLACDRAAPDRVLHTDLHYANVLEGDREPWLVIDPKPVNGDPHYEIAPMLWNRWDEISADVRAGVRRRFHALVDAADLDEDRARAWVSVRMAHNAMWALDSGMPPDSPWLTKCVAVVKAVGN